MRAFVLTLALLAALKIWVQDNAYRSATEEALVHAYQARAVEACAKLSQSPQLASGVSAFPAVDWSGESKPRVALGNPAIRVRIWQFDHELWNARFRQPYLILESAPAGLSCAFDILTDRAQIDRTS